MKFDEFFRAFHIGENDSALMSHTTTWAIPKFFAETVLKTKEYRDKLPSDQFSYDKWYQGNSSPRNHWSNMAIDFEESTLVEALKVEIVDAKIPELLVNLRVDSADGEINKELLCTAIAQQFKAIIDGKGKSDDIVAEIYLSGNIKADFMDYIHKASQRYNVMKLIGGDEVPLEKFFVCNMIGEKERVFADKKKIKCEYLDDPSLASIRNIYMKKRGYDNLKTILIGSGGCGKSLMLQYLFLKAAADYSKTGVLPIFLELRYFTQGDELIPFIVNSVHSKDEKFTEDAAKQLLRSGRCQLLLDGFDEIDPSDVESFLLKLDSFTDTYDKVQVVITSRGNEYLTGLHNYVKLYVWPFDNDQSLKLIDMILKYQGQTDEKETVIEYINNGFLKKDGVFASHPLLLTYVTMKYPTYKRFHSDHLLFYKSTYEALLSGHDDNKKPYDRVFMSVDNADQFSKVFKEFCGITYKDGVLQLDSPSFEEYFNKLKSHKVFENPHKMNLTNFKHDVCSTACMMYEKEYDIFYIDPGFQEYLFAEYYRSAEIEDIQELTESLKKTPYSKLLRFDALDMLSRSAELKFKTYVLVPFLDAICKGNDETGFINFINMCFNEINVVNVDEVVKAMYLLSSGATGLLYPQVENHPKTVLLNYVLKCMGEDHEFAYCLYTKDNIPGEGNIKKVSISEDTQISGVLIGPRDIYNLIKQKMFGKSQVHYFENVLDKCRRLIRTKGAGSTTVRYLLHTLNNKVIKNQLGSGSCWKLSDLYLDWGCIPFDQMPFATSLRQHNPESAELFGSLSADNRKHEFVARYMLSNMSTNAVLYTPVKELEEYTDNLDAEITAFNNRLYFKHTNRRIEKFGQSLYIQGAFQNTKKIIDKLKEMSTEGIPEYQEDVSFWLDLIADVDSEEKKHILQNMFDKTKVSLIYGAAGTGKTYLINHIANYMSEKSILFLANTNPAVENLRRKVTAIDPQKCEFMTIKKFLMSRYNCTDYDILVMDECSMVSNSDMADIIDKISCEIMILVGDTYQIESITFGNWFSMAKYFVPAYAWNELEKPYRTKDEHLLEFWRKVRNLDDDLTEYIVNHRYSTSLDSSVFDKKSADEIILCLNYDGLYGINNINRFLQENNKSKAYRWGLWTFKVGDPILFNETERFMPVLYNNLKGKIVDISLDEEEDCIWFSIKVEKEISEDEVWHTDLKLLESDEEGKSIVKFRVTRKKDSDDDKEFADDTDIPFQIAYAVSIHKAQGLEYDSVKVIITEEVDEMITHNIFYTAITRSKKHLKIYWSPETQEKVIGGFELADAKRDASIFKAQTGMKMYKVR